MRCTSQVRVDSGLLIIVGWVALQKVIQMKEMTLEYPEGLELAVQTTPEELGAQIRLMAALKMFELGKLSSGKAAELAGISRVEFRGCSSDRRGRYRVSVFNYPPEDLEAELLADVQAARETSALAARGKQGEGRSRS